MIFKHVANGGNGDKELTMSLVTWGHPVHKQSRALSSPIGVWSPRWGAVEGQEPRY